MESIHKIGASGANCFAKKNIAHNRINQIPIWYLLILKVDLDLERLLLLAKIHKMEINTYKTINMIFYIFFNSKLIKIILPFFIYKYLLSNIFYAI